ncbi:MAG: chemotaxis protein CheB [Desulfarculaceae bacterium]|nr:chemotaxis protein CheB [Desulfarculaceae bacterium]
MSQARDMGIQRAVVIGGSAGGSEAHLRLLGGLPVDFPCPILVVLHLHHSDGGALAQHLARVSKLEVVDPSDKEPIVPGRVYVAPANYHMLVERQGSIALSTEERVNWSRPSIDVLMESAAHAWGDGLIAIVLSGANSDGAQGLVAVKAAGGLTIAQNPAEATYGVMPQAAVDTGAVDLVMDIPEMAQRLPDLVNMGRRGPLRDDLMERPRDER